MVKKLRKRPRPDELVSEQRRMSNSKGRMVYLLFLILLFGAVANFMFGDFVFLRGDGLILRDKTSVAATYIARVEAVHINEGQSVKKDQPLLKLQSTHMLERLADLSAARARLAAKATEFKIRAETVSELLPLAIRRERESRKTLKSFDSLVDKKLISNIRYDQALQSRLEAQQAMVQYRTESKALSSELGALEAARKDADAALEDLRKLFGNGIVEAPAGGAIGASIPSAGDVYRPGETILSIYSGDAYVLAYLPQRYLFPIEPGMKIRVSSGRRSAVGTIGQILPLADALPKEFQNTFKPRERSQIARIRFDETPPFPLHQKVTLRRVYPWD